MPSLSYVQLNFSVYYVHKNEWAAGISSVVIGKHVPCIMDGSWNANEGAQLNQLLCITVCIYTVQIDVKPYAGQYSMQAALQRVIEEIGKWRKAFASGI